MPKERKKPISKDNINKNREKLKKDIVSFLSNCKNKTTELKGFWDALQKFTGKSRPKSDYGVVNLSHLFDLYKDVIICGMDYVKLLDQPVLNVASTSKLSTPKLSTPKLSTPKLSTPKLSTPWGAGAEIESVKAPMVIDLDSESDDSDVMIAGTDMTFSRSTGNMSEFISFANNNYHSNANNASSPPLPAHNRYGLSIPTVNTNQHSTPWNGPSLNFPSMSPIQPLMAQNFTSNNFSSVDPAIRPFNTSIDLTSQQRRKEKSSMLEDSLVLSRPSRRTGPPPGTKITEERSEIIVHPLNIPRTTILSSEMVNHEVQACIDDLSASGEHVSIERVENFLLKKFQVCRFSELGLRDRNITFLPAGREHSNILCKVNAYISNFIRSRSLCTLHELHECLREFHKEKKEFEFLKLGPLQKLPLIFEMFKFPSDEYIPEITTLDLMEKLDEYLTKYQKWQTKIELTEFMEFLAIEVYEVENPYSLGIRLRSLPLAIQMLKKSKRDASGTRKEVIERLKQYLCDDIKVVFQKFKAEIIQTGNDGDIELRKHYMSLEPEVALREIHSKFEMLQTLFVSEESSHRRKQRKFARVFDEFVKEILNLPLPRSIFHLAICLSNLEVQESVTEYIGEETKKQQEAVVSGIENEEKGEKRQPPTAAALIDKIILYINKCMEYGALTMKNLLSIETRLLEDYNFQNFSEMGHESFLHFLVNKTKVKTVLDELGVMSLNGNQDRTVNNSVSHIEILEFVCQAKKAGCVQQQQVESVLCDHYAVPEVRLLGHGNITRLMSSADKKGKHTSNVYNTLFESALCGKLCASVHCQGHKVGNQGSMSRNAAIACLTNCPLLEDLHEWSHWSLIFQPQHGPLREFIQKYGGLQEFPLEGGEKIVQSDISALEIAPGKLLKLTSRCTISNFLTSLETGVNHAAGYLVSLIAVNGGIEATPLALLANHVKTHLFSLNARTPVQQTEGTFTSSYEDASSGVNLAVKFVSEMLLRLPVRIAAAISGQVLLEPLSSVVGSTKSKSEVLSYCLAKGENQRLELLGCLLGLPEWTKSFGTKCEFPLDLVTQIPRDDIIGTSTMESENKEEDSDEEDDDEVDDNDIFDILSKDEDEINAQTSEPLVEDKIPPDEENQSDEDDDDSDDEKEIEDETESEISEEENTSADNENLEKDDDKDEVALNSDPNINNLGSESIPKNSTEELSREDICYKIVENIRRDEFGVGVQLDETGQALLKKQQQRQGRSLLRLSKDLYSKDTHFVLELIQNADDNTYTEVQPAVKFIIDQSGVIIQNNETGFEEKNIRALCDVGKSTKSKHQVGYIGQKGIGFKSVFRVTNRPEVHSNGFHICFDVTNEDMGYILPQWVNGQTLDENWQTHIILPWTDEIKRQIRSHAARFNDIQPTLLLFLHRLKKISIKNEVEGSELQMVRRDLQQKEVEIQCGDDTENYLVVKKVLDASKLSLQAKSGVNVESTEIALAFPLKSKNQLLQQKAPLKKQPVFAFLPLRSYGFKFIIQGDFDVPSSREDVDRDSSWNQWLRSEIPHLFVEALDDFKMRPDLSPVEALSMFLQFIPLDGEVVGFFTPITQHILTLLKDKNCMPVVSSDGDESVHWKKPSQTVTCVDSLTRDIINPALLHHELGLSYLHPDVLNVLDPALCQDLNITTLGVEHLLHVGRYIGLHWNYNNNPEQVMEISKWLACLYRSMDDFQDHTDTLKTLKNLKIIPLSCGKLVSLNDVSVFLLTETNTSRNRGNSKKNIRDPLIELKEDLNLVHADLIATPDAEINSQVVKLLLKMEINQLTPHDLIHKHILPVLKSQEWKEKRREIIISYIVYIKYEIDHNKSIIDMSELKPIIQLSTNHGLKNPSEDDVHFSKSFGNPVKLEDKFHNIDWTLVDSAYLSNNNSREDLRSWRNFMSDVGVVDFLRVRKEELILNQENLDKSPWSSDKECWQLSEEGYAISDWRCEEFEQIVEKGDFTQMEALFKLIDTHWNDTYSKYVHTQLKTKSGQILRDAVHTSFSIHLRSVKWIPSQCTTMMVDQNSKHIIEERHQNLLKAADVYQSCAEVKDLLAHTVNYIGVQTAGETPFVRFLKIRSKVSTEDVKNALISWSKRDSSNPDSPSKFFTSRLHICHIYEYLNDQLSNKGVQDLFYEHPVIFVPDNGEWASNYQPVAGHFMSRQEVWWSDSTELFHRYQESLHCYKSPLAKMKILCHLYRSETYERMFINTARVPLSPKTFDLAQLVVHLAKVFTLLEANVLTDVLYLFSEIGYRLKKVTEKSAGVSTKDAQLAEVDLPLVKDLLSKSAVFPTLQKQWVHLDAKPMISDSSELEDMFLKSPGVHFLCLEAPIIQDERARNLSHERTIQEYVEHLLSLFEEIKPLSECVKTTEMTSGFAPCSSGQRYLHLVVPALQRFLYHKHKHVYQKVKNQKAAYLKDLLFSQVDKLEVKYELKENPSVYEIRSENCIVIENHFHFNKDKVDSQLEINREVAKYFSEGNEECIRDLRSFLSQVVPILEGKSDESVDELMKRMVNTSGKLPETEEVWQVPLPVIETPKPEPPPLSMVYGRVSYNGPAISGNPTDDQNGELRSWPPRSADISQEQLQAGPKIAKTPSGQWPPPAPPVRKQTNNSLPSTIRFEQKKEIKEEECSQINQFDKPPVTNSSGAKNYNGSGSSLVVSSNKEEGRISEEQQVSKGDNSVVHQAESTDDESSVDRQNFSLRKNLLAAFIKIFASLYFYFAQRKRKLTDGSLNETVTPKRLNSKDDNVETSHNDNEGPRSPRHSADGQNIRKAGRDNERSSESTPKTGNRLRDSFAVTPVSESKIQRSNNGAIHFDWPSLSQTTEELSYTSLGEGRALTLPMFTIGSDAQVKEIGRWGEVLVWEYLQKMKQTDNLVEEVIWPNETMETGKPYDFEILYKSDQVDQVYSVFVEVKTTLSSEKEVFPISLPQIQFAQEQGEHFQIYRVFGAGGRDNVRLLRVDNIIDRIRLHQVSLMMVL